MLGFETAPQDGFSCGAASSYLLSSGLYRRLRNLTVSGAFALRRLYCRSGISPCPEDVEL